MTVSDRLDFPFAYINHNALGWQCLGYHSVASPGVSQVIVTPTHGLSSSS